MVQSTDIVPVYHFNTAPYRSAKLKVLSVPAPGNEDHLVWVSPYIKTPAYANEKLEAKQKTPGELLQRSCLEHENAQRYTKKRTSSHHGVQRSTRTARLLIRSVSARSIA